MPVNMASTMFDGNLHGITGVADSNNNLHLWGGGI